MPKKRGESGGFILVAGVLLLVVGMIMTPMLVDWMRLENKWSMKQKKSHTALALAEAGVDRAVWKLGEHATYWDGAATGAVFAGYNNDVVYTDVSGGSYRVKVSSGPDVGQITVVATGKDRTSLEFRAIEVIYDKNPIVASLYAPTLGISGSAEVHWGPIMSMSTIDLAGAANVYWPRKMSRGAITGSGSLGSRDTSPTAPNTDGVEWWSYNSFPVPDPPAVDLDYYKETAKTQACASPGGAYGTDCYYDTGGTITIDNLVDTDETKIRYFDNTNVKFTGSKHFRGKLVVLGNLDFVGSGKEPEGKYFAVVPNSAKLEYAKDTPDSSGTNPEDPAVYHDFPGDALSQLYDIKDKKCSPIGSCPGHTAGGEAPSFKGFIFVRGQISCSGSVTVHGAIFMDEGSSQGGGSFKVFYDDSLNVKMTGGLPTRVSWREVSPASF